MSSRFIHVVASTRISFIFKAEYYSTACIYYLLCVHSSNRGYLGCFHLLANIWLWILVYRYLLKSLLSVVSPEVELLYHIVILCLIFWRTTILFSAAAVLFHIPTSKVQGFHSRQQLLFSVLLCFVLFCFLVIVILLNVKRYFIVVFIGISLMIGDAEHLFICLLAVCISSLEKCLFKSFDHF